MLIIRKRKEIHAARIEPAWSYMNTYLNALTTELLEALTN